MPERHLYAGDGLAAVVGLLELASDRVVAVFRHMVGRGFLECGSGNISRSEIPHVVLAKAVSDVAYVNMRNAGREGLDVRKRHIAPYGLPHARRHAFGIISGSRRPSRAEHAGEIRCRGICWDCEALPRKRHVCGRLRGHELARAYRVQREGRTADGTRHRQRKTRNSDVANIHDYPPN